MQAIKTIERVLYLRTSEAAAKRYNTWLSFVSNDPIIDVRLGAKLYHMSFRNATYFQFMGLNNVTRFTRFLFVRGRAVIMTYAITYLCIVNVSAFACFVRDPRIGQNIIGQLCDSYQGKDIIGKGRRIYVSLALRLFGNEDKIYGAQGTRRPVVYRISGNNFIDLSFMISGRFIIVVREVGSDRIRHSKRSFFTVNGGVIRQRNLSVGLFNVPGTNVTANETSVGAIESIISNWIMFFSLRDRLSLTSAITMATSRYTRRELQAICGILSIIISLCGVNRLSVAIQRRSYCWHTSMVYSNRFTSLIIFRGGRINLLSLSFHLGVLSLGSTGVVHAR